MKALSVKQPWAWAIIHGGKDVENRVWNTNFRGRFLVVASRSVDMLAPSHLLESWLQHELMSYRNLVQPMGKRIGCVVGSVELVDVVNAYDSPWFTGPKGFILKDPKPLPPVNLFGNLGFFEVSDSNFPDGI